MKILVVTIFVVSCLGILEAMPGRHDTNFYHELQAEQYSAEFYTQDDENEITELHIPQTYDEVYETYYKRPQSNEEASQESEAASHESEAASQASEEAPQASEEVEFEYQDEYDNNDTPIFDQDTKSNHGGDESIESSTHIISLFSGLRLNPQRIHLVKQLSESSSNSYLLNQEYYESSDYFRKAQLSVLKLANEIVEKSNHAGINFKELEKSGYNGEDHTYFMNALTSMLNKVDELRSQILEMKNAEQRFNYHLLLKALLEEIYVTDKIYQLDTE